LEIRAEECTGCDSCVLACSFGKTGRFEKRLARIRTTREAERAAVRPNVCIQCSDAPCLDSCPESALSRSIDTGAVLLDPERCTGCRACVGACPHSGVHWHPDLNRPLICDLCDGEPECVKFCRFPEALVAVRGGDDA
jgi:carbon-monoxide dehydrogenase iron sulfur subunit